MVTGTAMSAPPLWPPPRRAWWAVLVFFLAAMLSYTDRQILLILIDPVRGELALSDTQVGLLQGLAFALVYSVAGLPLGRAADLFPRKIVILSGVLVWSLATVACALSHSFGSLFVARLFVGVGEACLAPAALSMIADYLPPKRRGVGIGIFVLGMVVGSGVAVMVGGSVLQAVQDGFLAGLPHMKALPPWRAVMILMAAPGLLLALLLLTVAEPVRRTHEGEQKGAASMRTVLVFFSSHRDRLLPLYLGMAAMAIAENAVLSWIPALLSRNFGMRPADIGTYYGGALIASASIGIVAGSVLADYLVVRHGVRGRYGLLVAGAIVALPGLLASGATSSIGVIGLASLFCMMSAATGTVAITAIQDIVPNQMRGIASAVSSVGNILIGVSLGAVLTPWADAQLFVAGGRLDLSMMIASLPLGVVAVLLFWRLLAAKSPPASIPG